MRTPSHFREKIVRLDLENRRIQAKENDVALSEGQMKTLQKNLEEMSRLDGLIYQNLNPVLQTHQREEDVADDDVREDDSLDQMIDLTQPKSAFVSAALKQTVQNFDSLQKRLKEINEEIAKTNASIAELSSVNNQEDEEEDPLDAFMAANNREIQVDDLEKHEKRLEQLNCERFECARLAEIAKPTISLKPATSTTGNSVPDVFKPAAPSTNQYRVVTDKEMLNVSIKRTKLLSAPILEVPALPAAFAPQSVVAPQNDREPSADPAEEQTAAWVPPPRQTGNGQSENNAKYGY